MGEQRTRTMVAPQNEMRQAGIGSYLNLILGI